MKSLLVILSLVLMGCTTESEKSSNNNAISPSDTLHHATMKHFIKGMYPVIITKDIRSTKQFYTNWFNFQVVFESTWFVLLASPGENASMIAFMSEVHPSTPPSPKAVLGDGVFVTIDVTDARVMFESLKSSGATFAYALTEEPWGQRRFALKDPNGIWLDVVEQIQPQEGWWDEYMVN